MITNHRSLRRIPPTPEDVAIISARMRRVLREAAVGYGDMSTAIERARLDYLHFPAPAAASL